VYVWSRKKSVSGSYRAPGVPGKEFEWVRSYEELVAQ
jgi:hypothetical protein